MKTIYVLSITAFAAALAAGVPAIGQEDDAARTESLSASLTAALPPEGPLRTMPHGTYQCALPGDAGSAAYAVMEEESFRIFTASRYESDLGAGTYIMRGDAMVFTRGPRKGERFERVGDNQLRKLDADGSATQLLCTRIGSR